MAESIQFTKVELILHPVSLQERLRGRERISSEDLDMDLILSDHRFIKKFDEKGDLLGFEYSYPWPQDQTQTVRCVFTRL